MMASYAIGWSESFSTAISAPSPLEDVFLRLFFFFLFSPFVDVLASVLFIDS